MTDIEKLAVLCEWIAQTWHAMGAAARERKIGEFTVIGAGAIHGKPQNKFVAEQLLAAGVTLPDANAMNAALAKWSAAAVDRKDKSLARS